MKPHFLSRNRTVLVGDLFFILVCVLGSFMLRVPLGARLFDFRYQILAMIVVALIIKPLVYYKFGLKCKYTKNNKMVFSLKFWKL